MSEDELPPQRINNEGPEEGLQYPIFLQRLGLPQALGLIVVASILIVVVGFGVYWGSQDRKYDIARPDLTDRNQELDVTDLEEDISKPVDIEAVENKLDFLRREKQALQTINNLDVTNLSDQNLQLIRNTQR